MIFEKISYLKLSKMLKKSKFKPAKMFKMAVFGASKFDFTENLSGRYILKFPHCASMP